MDALAAAVAAMIFMAIIIIGKLFFHSIKSFFGNDDNKQINTVHESYRDPNLDYSEKKTIIGENEVLDNQNIILSDEIYDQIGQELEEGQINRSVWTQAFAESNGDELKAKALYIKMRFSQLSSKQ